MPVKSATVLKSYFETNDRPTAPQFGDLIDTLEYTLGVAQQAIAVSNLAMQVATAASARAFAITGGAASPVGAVSLDGPAIYIQDDGTIWTKPAGSTGTDGWH